MDPVSIQSLLDAGPYGFLALCIWRMLAQDKKIDAIREQQITDTKVALDVVAKSTEKLADADQRQHAQIEASKELVAMVKVIINKDRI